LNVTGFATKNAENTIGGKESSKTAENGRGVLSSDSTTHVSM